jgi:rubrerythrin
MPARDQAIASLERNEGEEVERIVSSMSRQDLRDLESSSAHLQQMQPVLAQMRKETGQATMDKQVELMKAIVAKHQSELAQAKHNYEASHPSAPSSKTPK